MISSAAAVIFISIAMLIAHILAPKEYDWKKNTISELAFQGYRYKWIMQTGFIFFGALLTLGIIQKMINIRFQFKYIPIIAYAVSVLFSGIYCTKPFLHAFIFSVKEYKLHMFFAQTAGIFFSIGLLLFFLQEGNTIFKIVHFGTLLFVAMTSIAFGLVPKYSGIFQRILYMGSFIWIIFFI